MLRSRFCHIKYYNEHIKQIVVSYHFDCVQKKSRQLLFIFSRAIFFSSNHIWFLHDVKLLRYPKNRLVSVK
jgi:hypothetical protein